MTYKTIQELVEAINAVNPEIQFTVDEIETQMGLRDTFLIDKGGRTWQVSDSHWNESREEFKYTFKDLGVSGCGW